MQLLSILSQLFAAVLRSARRVLAGGFALSAASAQVAIWNPIGEVVAGESVGVFEEQFAGMRFSVADTFVMTGVAATFLESDGSPFVAVLLSAGETGFPSVAPLNPGHPDVVDFAIYDGMVINSATEVTVSFSATLGAGDYALVFVTFEQGQTHALQAYQTVAGSAGVVFTQELDGSGFIINETMAWGLSEYQPDIRLLGTLIPEPSATALLAGVLALGGVLARRRR